MNKFYVNLPYLAFVAANIASALGFSLYSDGFYTFNRWGQLFRCDELMSSSGDDSVTMAYFIFLLIPFGLRLSLFGRKPPFYEVAIFCGLFLLGILFVLVASDCGSLLITTFVKGNLYLIIFLLSGAGALFELLRLHIRQ